MHYPHLDSQARLEWNKKPKAMEKYHYSASELQEDENIDWGSFKRARVDALFLDFKEWLDGTVEDESRTPMCDDALNDDVRLWVHSDRLESDSEEENAEEDTDDGEDTEVSINAINEEEEQSGSGDSSNQNSDRIVDRIAESNSNLAANDVSKEAQRSR